MRMCTVLLQWLNQTLYEQCFDDSGWEPEGIGVIGYGDSLAAPHPLRHYGADCTSHLCWGTNRCTPIWQQGKIGVLSGMSGTGEKTFGRCQWWLGIQIECDGHSTLVKMCVLYWS